MDRRKALKLLAGGTVAAGGAGVVTLTTAFKNDHKIDFSPKKIKLEKTDSKWIYTKLDPNEACEIAYRDYSVGSCMYGVVSGIVTLLAEKIGEPYASFPKFMMKYGHGGIGGSGSVCGTLNGATALFGLLINNKKISDALTSELFNWYETTELPLFTPSEPNMDFTPPTSVANSILCHASTTRWGKEAGYRTDSKERKERCRRLTADIAGKTVEILNLYFDDKLVIGGHNHETAQNCMACHGKKGKLGNTSGKMKCTTCHDQSVAHKLFGDVHYKYMDKK
jgi:hypothetical protein